MSDPTGRRVRRRYEPPQPGNPHKLTINQHVHSAAAIRRFADAQGKVAVLRQGNTAPFRVRPEDAVFCVKRVWNQHLENNFRMFEEIFQAECEAILRTHTVRNHQAITDYLAVWHVRSWLAEQPPADVEAPLFVAAPNPFTKDQEEQLEAKHMMFIRGDRILPGRFRALEMGMRGLGMYTFQLHGSAGQSGDTVLIGTDVAVWGHFITATGSHGSWDLMWVEFQR